MTQFKVNDKVTVKAGCKHECVKLEDKVFDYLLITGVDSDDGYTYTAYRGGEKVTGCMCYKDDHLELYVAPVITWDTLKWKDVVVDRYGDKRLVLGVLNDAVFLSGINNFNVSGAFYHKEEIQTKGYTIKQAPVEKLELTLEQVAEKFGVEVGNLKIK